MLSSLSLSWHTHVAVDHCARASWTCVSQGAGGFDVDSGRLKDDVVVMPSIDLR